MSTNSQNPTQAASKEARQALLTEARKESLRRFGNAVGKVAVQVGCAAIMGITAGIVIKYSNTKEAADKLAA